MATATAAYTFHYPNGYNDRVEAEMTDKGYLPGVVVELADGPRYELTFYDPVRLGQNAERMTAGGSPMIVAINTVVVAEVTPAAIESAVEFLVLQGYIRHLKPVAPTPA